MVLWRVLVLSVCVRMSLCRLECRSAKFCMLGDVSFFVPCIWGHVLSPLIVWSASVNFMSGFFFSFYDVARGCVRLVVVSDFRV